MPGLEPFLTSSSAVGARNQQLSTIRRLLLHFLGYASLGTRDMLPRYPLPLQHSVSSEHMSEIVLML